MAQDEKELEPQESEPRLARFLDRMLVSPREKVLRSMDSVRTTTPRPASGCCAGTDPKTPIIPEPKLWSPGVLWDGVAVGWSGYAKANRELMLRVANHLTVEYAQALNIIWNHAPGEARLDAHKRQKVAHGCPWLRFFGPDVKVSYEGRRRIIYTMMETGAVHPDMVGLINAGFDELWAPTQWNAGTFKDSGVKIPIRTAPLGVDSVSYRPLLGAKLPACTLQSTDRAGDKEIPQGFIFISVGLPSFRKGFDVLSRAFEDAFAGDSDAALVCAVTHSSPNAPVFEDCRKMKSRIYSLEGEYDEHQMSRIYNAANAYATASRGEGWNLPLCEAAACGLPVICGDNTSHGEVAGDLAFMFKSEGQAPVVGAESVSPWYKDVPFTTFGKKSHAELVDQLLTVRGGGPEVRRRASALRKRMIDQWTWDASAAEISRRLLEMQP